MNIANLVFLTNVSTILHARCYFFFRIRLDILGKLSTMFYKESNFYDFLYTRSLLEMHLP